MIMKKFLILILLFNFAPLAHASSNDDGYLQRIRKAKELIAELEPRSAEDIAQEFIKTSSPEGNVQIFEAIAATYNDLIIRKNIVEDEGKKDLYNQIRLNVAFIQFGGDPSYEGGKKLNRWIRQTLMKYLSKDLISDEDIFYSAGEWNKK